MLTLIIQLLYVMPSRIMMAVLSMFRMSFCAVPPFIRDEPLMTSAPTAAHTVRSALFDIGVFSTQTIAAVFALLLFANSSAASVYGVVPLAATPIKISYLVSFLVFSA